MDPYVQEYHAWKARFALTNPKNQQPTSAHAILWCLSRYPDELNTMSHFLRVASLHHTSIQEKCKEMRAQKVIEVVRVCGATRAYVYALHASVRPSATPEEVDCSSMPRRNAFLSILEYLRCERESERESSAVDKVMALDMLSAQRQPVPLAFVSNSNNNNNSYNNNNNNNNSNSSSSGSANTSSFNSAIAAAAAALAASSAVCIPSSSSLSALLADTSASPASNDANTNADTDAIHADSNAKTASAATAAAVNSSIAIVAAATSTDLSPSATTTSTLTPAYTNTQQSTLTHASTSSNVNTVNMNINVNNSNKNSTISAGINPGPVVPLTAEHFDRSLREHMQRRFAPHFDASADALKVSRYALTVNSSERVVFQRVLEILQRLQPCGSCWLAPNELMHKTVMEIKSGITRGQMKKLTSFAWEGAEAMVVRHDPLHCESSSEHSRCCRPSHLCFGPKSAQQRDSAISAALRIQRLSSKPKVTAAQTAMEGGMTTPRKEVQREEITVEGEYDDEEEEYVYEDVDMAEADDSVEVPVTPPPNRKRSREEEEKEEDFLDDS